MNNMNCSQVKPMKPYCYKQTVKSAQKKHRVLTKLFIKYWLNTEQKANNAGVYKPRLNFTQS